MSIIEIFETLIDIQFIERLVTEARRYALFINYPDSKVAADQIYCFIAILFVGGYYN